MSLESLLPSPLLNHLLLRRVTTFDVPYTPAQCEALLRDYYGPLVPTNTPIWPPVRFQVEGFTATTTSMTLRFRSVGSTMTSATFEAVITQRTQNTSQIQFSSESQSFGWYAASMGLLAFAVLLFFFESMVASMLILAVVVAVSIFVVRTDITDKQVTGLNEFRAALHLNTPS